MSTSPRLKLAIVGGGPSAFYVASRLLQLLPSSNPLGASLRIHIYDRLWAPHGLVRYGVAPDHPEVKNCTHKFDQSALDPRLRFFGNVDVISPLATTKSVPNALRLPFFSLYPHYSHLLLSTGCTVPRLHPSLPHERYCTPALSLVHWYTQHPSLPKAPPLDKIKHITIFGHGNVSLDVARMLLTEPDELAKYDVPDPVLNFLRKSTVEHVSIVGRRGPMEAQFTTKELREMMNLPTASMQPLDKNLIFPLPDVKPTRQQARLLSLLSEGSKNAYGSTKKTWSLHFYSAPAGFERLSSSESFFEGKKLKLTLSHTMLDKDLKAVPTGIKSELLTDYVVQSLGYSAEPSLEWYDQQLGYLRNVSGRMISANWDTYEGVYTSGWASTGAKGVLASTMMNAYTVADTIISDLLPRDEQVSTSAVEPQPSPAAMGGSVIKLLNPDADLDAIPLKITKGLKKNRVFEYADWKAVDEEEIRRAQKRGKERERLGWLEVVNFVEKWRQKSKVSTPP